MQICWWEHAELLEHLRSRPDIWVEDSGLWIRKTVAGTPAFALQLIEPESTGPYRQYTLVPTPVEWSDDDISEYLEKLVWHWTSYSTRLEFTKIMVSELGLDPNTAELMAIALQRATVEPKQDPEKLPEPPKQEPLWAWDLPWPPKTGVMQEVIVGKMLLPYPGGSITMTEHGGMLRVRFEIHTERNKTGVSSIAMQGFCKPLGYTVQNFLAQMRKRTEPVVTDDLDAQLDMEAILHGELTPVDASSADSSDLHSDSADPTLDDTGRSESGETRC